MPETPPNPNSMTYTFDHTWDPEIQLMIGIQAMVDHFQTKGLDELAIKRVLDHMRAKRVMAG